jgi:hypothetical protein
MPAEQSGRRYRLDPADTSGVFLGLSLIQCLLIGGGLMSAACLLSARAPLAVASTPVLVGCATSFARLGGRSLWEWLPVLAGWVWSQLTRRRRWRSPLSLLPDRDGGATRLPPCLAGLTVVETADGDRGSMGAVADATRHTLTAVLRVSGGEFVARDAGEQDRLVAGWGEVLNQFALDQSPVSHVAWSDLSVPSSLAEHRAWLETVAAGTPCGGELACSYQQLLSETARVATRHEVLVTVTVARNRLHRRAGRRADTDTLLGEALVDATRTLRRALQAANLSPEPPLGVEELRRVLRARLDPSVVRPALAGGRLVERLGLVRAANAGPMALDVSWDHLRVDGSWARAYQVVCWPRTPVDAGWMEPFLAAVGVTRVMTVVFCPVPAWRSRRRIEQDLVKLDSDADTKQDKGRRVDARHHRSTVGLLEREQELGAGFAEMGYLAVVSVSAPTMEELDRDGSVVEQLAREAGMDLRCLVGRQDLAWAAALPLGLAPRSLLT